ncbi:MAG: hypothetical protein N3B21_14730 [Clostridia bacterium]|nr:hypothetical protein [Clostridia bacterium]
MEGWNYNRTIRLGGFLLIIFLVIYIPALLNWKYGKAVNTQIIRMGTIEDSVNLDGYIIRQEEVLKSPFEGKCITEVGEGEKVSSNYRIATILKDSAQKLYEDLKQKDLEILKAQKGKSANREVFSEDIEKLDEEIAQKLKLVISESNRNSMIKVRKLREDIDETIQRKATIFGSASISDAYINSLKKDKQILNEQIKSSTKEIFSITPGIVSYSVDGYENVLKPEKIKEMTPKFLNSIESRDSRVNINNFSVEVQKPFVKVIKDIECYIVVAVDPQIAKKFGVDDGIKVRINDINKVIDGIVDYKSSEEEGKYIVSVKIDKYISDIVGLRKINIDLIKTAYSGLKIPVASLKDFDRENMKAKIALAKGNYASIRTVKVVGSNDEFAIIDNLDGASDDGVGLYNSFVINPKNVQEGQMINR